MAAIALRFQTLLQRMFLSTEMQVRFECLGIDRVWPSFAITVDF